MIDLTDLFDAPGDPAAGFRFVGRARELDRLLAAVRRPPAAVLIEGEGGIGKSRLVRESVTALGSERRCVLIGWCHPLREPLAYGPVVDALGRAGPWLPAGGLPQAAAPLGPLLPQLADRFPPLKSSDDSAVADRLRIVHAVRAFLAALGPTVLIVEDVHWIDEATRDLLLLLARDLPPQLSLVITYRAEDLPPDTPVLGAAYRRPTGTNGMALQLRPLAGADIRALAAAALGGPVPDDLVTALHERSAGLPLIAEEDLITLREHRVAHEPGDGDLDALHRAHVPSGLRDAVTERLVRLSPSAASLVAAAAVLAVPASETLLHEVAGLDEDEEALALLDALHAAILHETDDGRYDFRHVLARKVAYERVLGPTRRRLHLRALRVLAGQEPPPLVQIAHHTLALGDHRTWALRMEQAAGQATALGDSGTAAALLRQVLHHPRVDPEARSRAALGLAPLAGQGVDFVTNATALRTILADARLLAATRGEIRTGLGLLLLNQGSDRAGFGELARAVDELGHDSPRAVAAMVGLAMDEYAGPDAAEHWMSLAEKAVRDIPGSEPAADVRATRLTLRAWAADPTLDTDLARLPREGVDVRVLRQTARALYNAGVTAADVGEDHRAADLIDESVRLARTCGFPVLQFHARVSTLRLDALAGRWEGLRERFEALGAEYPDTAQVEAEAALHFGVRDLAHGRHSRALRHFSKAAAGGAQRFDLGLTLRSATGITAVQLAQDTPDEGWKAAQETLALLRRAAAWPKAGSLLSTAAAAGLGCGEEEAVRTLVAEAEHGIAGRAAPASEAALHTARGLLAESGDPERAAREHAAAHAIWERMPRPYEAARSAELQTRALAPLHPERAADILARALGTYSRLDAVGDLARARRLERSLGLKRPGRPGRRGYGDRLSPRETSVAELLARGLTNQEIADALVLSPRTVEHHVASVLRKLATTRKDVSAAFRGAGVGRLAP
ncbi:AAA family ATPase [Streptomyces sp. NPDC047974]|uniref:ATP-binding protein n=1 Tax=Streptomyces sp. NPDC047974 TaxID=3154343 RepID=UPI003406D8DB